MSNSQKLMDTFAQALDLPDNTGIECIKYREIPEWDSVAHMVLVGAIEDNFDVMLDTDEVIGMSSFKIARDILSGHGVSF